MKKNNNIVEFEKVFERNVLKKKLQIKVEGKTFNVKRNDKTMMLAGAKVKQLMELTNELENIDLEQEGTSNDVANIMDITISLSELINQIIVIMSGQELLDYVDDELEFESKEKMELAMTLYQMPQITNDGVSNIDEGSFQ
jgi:hypothetical protein